MAPPAFGDLAQNFRKPLKWDTSQLQLETPLTALEWSPDGAHFAVGQMDGQIGVFDADLGRTAASDLPSTSRVASLAFNETSDLFVATSADSSAVLCCDFNSRNGQLENERQIMLHEKPRFLSFMEDRQRGENMLISGGVKGLELYDVEGEQTFRIIPIKGGVTSFRSCSGCLLAVGVGDKSVQIWDARVQRAVWEYRPKNIPAKPCFDVDGANRLLLVADETGGIFAADLGTRKISPSAIKVIGISSHLRFAVISDTASTKLANFNDPLHPTTQSLHLPVITGARWQPEQCNFVTRASDRTLRLCLFSGYEK